MLSSTPKKRKRMNKFLFVLCSFFVTCALSVAVAMHFGNTAGTAAASLLYLLLYFVTANKREKSVVTLRKGALLLLFFLEFIFFISMLFTLVFSPQRSTVTLGTAATALLLAPIAEELFFRGTLFKVLKESFSLPFAVVFSSVAFAFVHSGLSAVLTAFFAGVILALIYSLSKSVWLCVLCHFLNNALALFVTVDKRYVPVVLVISLISLVLTAIYVKGIWENEE